MALIVEDGSGVPGANSYVTVEEIRDYCSQRGLALPAEVEGVETLAVTAFDYVEMFEPQFKGYKTEPNQRTAFPRSGVVIGKYQLPSNEIPWQLKDAQCQATAEALDADLLPNLSAAVKKEKVDVIEVEYQDSAPTPALTIGAFPKVDLRLRDLIEEKSSFPRIRVVRR